jgi:predicted 3-demethylubiquinone-9 3-methyltransferase (glyoxalase superfamily)
MQKISPYLWFDDKAEEAANFYVSLFDDARITYEQRYPEGPPGPAGEIMIMGFELFGQAFVALNGGPQYSFTPAISFLVDCEDQAEVDRYWKALTDGGEEQPCGWLTDRFGVSWQIIPRRLMELLSDPDPGRSQRAMQAMLQMKKIDVQALEDAADAA